MSSTMRAVPSGKPQRRSPRVITSLPRNTIPSRSRSVTAVRPNIQPVAKTANILSINRAASRPIARDAVIPRAHHRDMRKMIDPPGTIPDRNIAARIRQPRRNPEDTIKVQSVAINRHRQPPEARLLRNLTAMTKAARAVSPASLHRTSRTKPEAESHPGRLRNQNPTNRRDINPRLPVPGSRRSRMVTAEADTAAMTPGVPPDRVWPKATTKGQAVVHMIAVSPVAVRAYTIAESRVHHPRHPPISGPKKVVRAQAVHTTEAAVHRAHQDHHIKAVPGAAPHREEDHHTRAVQEVPDRHPRHQNRPARDHRVRAKNNDLELFTKRALKYNC